MSEQSKDEFVNKDTCDQRHTSTKFTIWGIISLTAVFLALVVFAVNIALAANNTALESKKCSTELETDIKVHVAQDIEQGKYIINSLEEIKKEQRKLTEKVDGLSEVD